MCISRKKSGLWEASFLQDQLKENSLDTQKATKFIVYGYRLHQIKYEKAETSNSHQSQKRPSVLTYHFEKHTLLTTNTLLPKYRKLYPLSILHLL